MSGEVIDSPTVNSYVVGVEVAPPAPPATAAPAPAITALNPITAQVGSSPFTLNIYGTGITPDVQVWMGGVAVNTGWVSPGQVDTAVDPTTATAGNTEVWVVTGAGQSNTVNFTFNPGAQQMTPEEPDTPPDPDVPPEPEPA